MAAECSRCSLAIPKEVVYLPFWLVSPIVSVFNLYGHFLHCDQGYSLKLFWKKIPQAPLQIMPTLDCAGTTAVDKEWRLLLPRRKLNFKSRDDDTFTGIPRVSHNSNPPSPSSGHLSASLDDVSRLTDPACAVTEVALSIPAGECFLIKDLLLSLYPALCLLHLCKCRAVNPLSAWLLLSVILQTVLYQNILYRRQCAVNSNLQIVNPHDEAQSLTPDFPVPLSIPQLNLPE